MKAYITLSQTCALVLLSAASYAQDTTISNYKSGISATWSGTRGIDYEEEYLYHDKLVSDKKIVYLKSTTKISLAPNASNRANYSNKDGGNQVIGVNGLDGLSSSGDEGVIRYRFDRDRNNSKLWSDNLAKSATSSVLPSYSSPINLETEVYETGSPLLGTIGSNGADSASTSACYYRGILDSYGDEWHTLAYGHDDNVFLRKMANFVDQDYFCSDGKSVLLVVNPKTPCLTVTATGTAQFCTTSPKAYLNPKVVDQTTYVSEGSSGTITITLTDIGQRNISYRLNGGAWVNLSKNTASLSASAFSQGENTLEYKIAGTGFPTKSRKVTKNPTHPSASETHGNLLWSSTNDLDKIKQRITRLPYKTIYDDYKIRPDKSGRSQWDLDGMTGGRGTLGGFYTLGLTFVSVIEGWNYQQTGSPISHGKYAKQMMLNNIRTLDSVGWEMSHSADGNPSKEINNRGYYNSIPILGTVFTYDVFAANFRDDQVAGGMTAIENIFVRETLAGFAFECMQWTSGLTRTGAPGMWGGARLMAASIVALVLSEYSSPLYGTSGFGSNQAVYSDCPFPDIKLTWRQAFFDQSATANGFPNYKWKLGLSNNGQDSLFFNQGDLQGGIQFAKGDFRDKNSYYSVGLMGIHFMVYANVFKRYLGGGVVDDRLEASFERATKGLLAGGKDPNAGVPTRQPMVLLMNGYWPARRVDNLSWLKSLPSTDGNSPTKQMQDVGVFGFAWYDDDESTLPLTAPGDVSVTIKVE
jgi:hypothetical protein